jgi:hypothetical protein
MVVVGGAHLTRKKARGSDLRGEKSHLTHPGIGVKELPRPIPRR